MVIYLLRNLEAMCENMKGTLSKKQRERKINRRRLSEIMGDRTQNWMNFVKKDNLKTMSEEQRDRSEGERMVREMDERMRDQ